MDIKKPNALLYFIAYIVMFPFLKIFFRLKVDKIDISIPKNSPYIVLSNHSTMLDFLISMLPLYPRRLNAVTAQKFFYYSPMHKLLPMLGCIPKNLFDPDIRSIAGIKTALKRGGGVILFPEGRCSHSQAYAGIHIATGKLLKKLGVPVISCYIEGAVNCLPLWRKGMKSGRVRVTYRELFSADDLKQMDVNDINAAIGARLSGAEGAAAPKKPLRAFNSKHLAQGLEKLLYYCPSCKQEYTTQTENNIIRCISCGFEATLNCYGKFEYSAGSMGIVPVLPDIPAWYAEQMRYETECLRDNMQPIEIKVKLRTPSSKSGGGMEDNGSGTLLITPKGWSYDGKHGSEHISLFFPVDTVPALNDDTFNNIQFFSGGNFYVFVPEDQRMCMKYLIIAECLHRKFANPPLLTAPHGGYPPAALCVKRG